MWFDAPALTAVADQSKVSHDKPAVLGHEHVGRLEVAVQDLFAMQMIHRPRDLPHLYQHLRRLRRREPLGLRAQRMVPVEQRAARHELAEKIVEVSGLEADAEELDAVRVVELRPEAHLVLQQRQVLGCEARRSYLFGHSSLAVELTLEDRAEAAGSNPADGGLGLGLVAWTSLLRPGRRRLLDAEIHLLSWDHPLFDAQLGTSLERGVVGRLLVRLAPSGEGAYHSTEGARPPIAQRWPW